MRSMNVFKSKVYYQSKKGFTIVELLIVIVVIAILAAISIVAYDGIQERSKNAQTVSALSAWIKGLKLYKVDNGKWPNGWVCLGDKYPYGEDGTATSGAQCRQDANSYTVNAGFNSTMSAYMGSFPNPAHVTASNGSSSWWRGLMYAYGGGDGTQVYIIAVYAGVLSACPVVEGYSTGAGVTGGNTRCTYIIGSISDS
mgnify:CR=1 FL=1